MNTAILQLVERLGGPVVLGQIVRDFYSQMAQDTMIGFFFADKDIVRIAAKQTAFLLRAAGLPTEEEVRPLGLAHAALPPILPGFFYRRIKILEQVLNEHRIPAEDSRIWLDFERSFSAVVIDLSAR